jgi:hypothetical protein
MARVTFNDVARKGPYTKTLYEPVTYEEYNLYRTRRCNNPVGERKPFPYRVQTGSSTSGCGTSNIYLEPPDWYTALKPGEDKMFKDIPQKTVFVNEN